MFFTPERNIFLSRPRRRGAKPDLQRQLGYTSSSPHRPDLVRLAVHGRVLLARAPPAPAPTSSSSAFMADGSNSFAPADASDSSASPSHRMEYVVEGEDIDPQVLTEPGWLNIRRKIAAAEATAATRTSQAPTAGDQPRKRCQKRHKRKPTPPEDPLPDNDIKVILRPQGGLDLTSVNAATLADVLQDQAKLPRHAADQVRLHYRSNFIVVSTPSEARAQCYLELPSLLWKEATSQ